MTNHRPGSVMIISIQQPEYFPWVGYFDKFVQVDEVVILDNVQFKKRYFENRNKVRTAKGWCWIRTPVLTKGRFNQLIMDVEIDNTRFWKNKLADTIRQNYYSAPYWKTRGEELCTFIESSNHIQLVEFNLAIIYFLAEALGVAKRTRLASSLKTHKSGSSQLLEICRWMNCETYLSGRNGRNYLNEEAFRSHGIEIRYQDFTHPVYPQHQGGGFVPAMSALDMLFNLGPECAEMFSNRVLT